MRKKRLPIILICFIALLSLGYLIRKPALSHLSGFLSKSEKVNANVLIVEGWLPEYAVENAYNEFQKNGYDYIITTGLKLDVDYFKESMGGYLIFYPKDRLSLLSEPGPHVIEISAYSELEAPNCAHFNVFVNDSLVSNFYADVRKRKYLTNWAGKLTEIDSVMVQFDNDKVGDFGDRNLYVKEVIIDHKISIPYPYNTVYDIVLQHGLRRIYNNYNSNAELTRNRLLSLGIDSSEIKALPGKKARLNRTLTSALAVQDWLGKSNMDVKGINIVSVGTHYRRTWMTYNRVQHRYCKIGIIALPDNKNSRSGISRFIKTLRETIAIIYYWFILIPY